jgi:serine/threonine-protein kinase
MQWQRLEASHWPELSALLDTALELPHDARAAWLEALAPQHPIIKECLRSLLARSAQVETRDFLGSLPRFALNAAELAALQPVAEQPGECIGPYRLTRELGLGGMSTVWLAQRIDGLIPRPVALKLPQGIWRRGTLVERFARERQLLAALAHPNIARLYDAGVAASGQPYLALEYVEGRPIDVYCREASSSTRARVALFLQVARAVAYAHGKLIVHRDLKPANILVTAEGDVRLLDFGIAKLLDAESGEAAARTELSQLAFTPDYASPEQIAGEPITTASDVYSLGVVLYELLSGARPYRLERATRGALERAIALTNPPRPSALAPGPLAKQLYGDLDTIVLKALKKNPDERYATVSALADDLERYTSHRPVLARPDSVAYRCRKFVRRNRLLVAGAATVTFAIVTGTAMSLWQTTVARAEQRRAEEFREFLASTIRDADPHQGAGHVLTAADLLRQARARADSLSARPEMRVEMLALIASSLLNLEDLDAAEDAARQAVDEALASLGPDHEQTMRARMAMVGVHRFRGRTDDMRRELDAVEQALAATAAPSAADRFFVLESRGHLAIDAGEYEQAVAAALEALTLAERSFGESDARTAAAATLLAEAYEYSGVTADVALAAAERAFALSEAVHGANERHPRLILARSVYGRALARAGQVERGVAELETALAHGIETFGATSSTVGFLSDNISRYERQLGRIHSAIEHLDRALAILGANAQRDSFTYLSPLTARGVTYLTAREPAAALRDLDESWNGLLKLFGAEHEETAIAAWNRALALAMLGRAEESRAAFAPALELYRTTYSDPLYLPSRPLAAAAAARRLGGDAAGALALAQEAQRSLADGGGAERSRLGVLVELGFAELELGNVSAALAHFEAAEMIQTKLGGQATPAQTDLSVGLGRTYLALGEPQRALLYLESAAAFWRAFDADNRWAGEAALWLGRSLAGVGRANEAREAFERARAILQRSPIPSDAALLERQR